MKISELDRAKREALTIFDEWNDVTGFVTPHTSYYDELTSIIEDAVECGAAYATDNVAEFKKRMASERGSALTPSAHDEGGTR